MRKTSGTNSTAISTNLLRGNMATKIQLPPVDEETLSNYNEWRENQGLAPLAGKRERVTRAIRISDKAWAQLMREAVRLKYRSIYGRSARAGSVSDLMEALGTGILHLERGSGNNYVEDED